ncbi:limonene-1,2-epoxide hydrolase [Solimonas aquatica]|uniref:Limonene-1,2-epoxide hydrolase n=2 Tax=Solimonas aquatica TaxID=489703 RepID=A0A1H9LJI3_9GAMM|nr:limonene-1,2-epoxide hydrolase [Solimonas aquatica]
MDTGGNMKNVELASDGAAELVRGFLGAWRERDLDRLVGFFADAAVYHNVPVEPIRGVAGIRHAFARFLEMFERASLDIVNIASDSNLVLVERIDRFVMRDGRGIELPVTGVFEVADGKIVRFSDYFDLGDFQRQSGLSL